MPFTIFFLKSFEHLFLESGNAFFKGHVFVDFVRQARSFLLRHAVLDELFCLSILFRQFVLVRLYILKNDVEFRAGQCRHNLLNFVEIIASV
jgi:hypothetical protein